MTTTSQVRIWWSPPCKSHEQTLGEAYKALDDVLKKWRYAPRQVDTGAFNCRPITGDDPDDGIDYSLHAYNPDGFFIFWNGTRITKALAVDLNWNDNDYGPILVTDMPEGMVAEIKAIRTSNGKQVWRWGGDYTGNKDAMHYEIICSPTDLATGVRRIIEPIPELPEEEDDVQKNIVYYKHPEKNTAHAYIIGGMHAKFLVNQAGIDTAKFFGVREINDRDHPIGLDAQRNMIIVDGPCKNV